jgi:hypothetical protein
MSKKSGAGPYHGNMGREAIRQDRSVDASGVRREAKRSVGEGPARGTAAPLPKTADARFSGGSMTRSMSAPRPRRYTGG